MQLAPAWQKWQAKDKKWLNLKCLWESLRSGGVGKGLSSTQVLRKTSKFFCKHIIDFKLLLLHIYLTGHILVSLIQSVTLNIAVPLI